MRSPHVDRVMDYILGGASNFGADRDLAEELLHLDPTVMEAARVNHVFKYRALRWLLSQGVSQFLDLGSGLPIGGTVFELVKTGNPDARVAYVSDDSVWVARLRALSAGDSHMSATRISVTEVEDVLSAPGVRGLLDFEQPIGVLLWSTLILVPDEGDPYSLVSRYCGAVPEGSYLVLSQLVSDDLTSRRELALERLAKISSPIYTRPLSTFVEYFEGMEIQPPGVVPLEEWPEPERAVPPTSGLHGGVARIPAKLVRRR